MDTLKEEWREIKENPLYMVSNKGEVVSFTRENAKILKKRVQDNCIAVNIRVNGVYKNKAVGKLVADHFLPNPNNNKYVFFKDGNIHNARVDNLVWMNKENITKAIAERRKNTFINKNQLSLFD